MLDRLRDVFSSFEKHDVRCVVIGGIADIQTSTPGLAFADAWAGKTTMEYGGRKLQVASRAHLIAAKRASGRPVDLEDVRLLELEE
jgi:hypothetical protein